MPIPRTGFRPYVNRDDVNNNNAEIQNEFYWDIEIIQWPAVVYYPGDKIYKGRLISVSGLPQLTHSPELVDGPGGFKIIQTGEVDHGNADITCEFQDFDDQKVWQALVDWANCCQSAREKYSYRKADVIGAFNIYQLDSQLKPIRKWIFETCMIGNTGDDATNFGNKKTPKGKLSPNFVCEFWDVEKLN